MFDVRFEGLVQSLGKRHFPDSNTRLACRYVLSDKTVKCTFHCAEVTCLLPRHAYTMCPLFDQKQEIVVQICGAAPREDAEQVYTSIVYAQLL